MKRQTVCYCNNIPLDKIAAAISRGCRSMEALMNATNAGLGQCGGTCRPDLEKLLRGFNETGEFPVIAQRRPPPKR